MLSFILLLGLPFSSIGCQSSTGSNGNSTPLAVNVASASPSPSPTPAASPERLTIDGERAFSNAKTQVDFGPRPAGSAQLAKTRDFIIRELKSYGLNPTTDKFTAATPSGNIDMFNIIAELPGESKDVIVISSHYDTKVFKNFKFVGADDGASSTAVLMEIARAMAGRKDKPKFTYKFVFFDGEEAVCKEWDQDGCGTPENPDHTYGSQHFVNELIKNSQQKQVRTMILLDMIGYKNLELGRDDMSTGWLVDAIWNTAKDLGYSDKFLQRPEGVGGDDHEPFLKAGIESVDLIQLGSYPYWHTQGDTLDKISAQSMKIVGDVVLASLPAIERHLGK